MFSVEKTRNKKLQTGNTCVCPFLHTNITHLFHHTKSIGLIPLFSNMSGHFIS